MESMSLSSEQNVQLFLHETIERLATESIPELETGRRSELRRPFCRPLSILRNDGSTILSAYSRDISPKGIGLMHSFPLEAGEVIIQIPSCSGKPVRVRTEIRWCRSITSEWHVSGGQFLELLGDE